GCRLAGDGEEGERKCCPDRCPRHEPIGTQPRRCRQCECDAHGTSTNCAEEYAVGLRAARDLSAYEKRQERPIDAREREESGASDEGRAQIRVVASVSQTTADGVDEALGGQGLRERLGTAPPDQRGDDGECAQGID